MMLAIAGYPGYWVTSDGEIFTAGCRKKHKPNPVPQRLAMWRLRGYPNVNLGPQRKRRYVHHLVLEAFRGSRPTPAHECRHLDGDRTNNTLDNLVWGTQRENRIDNMRHGTLPLKITDEDVAAIRASSEDSRVLAARYGISRGYVYNIRNHTWRKERWL